MECRIVFKQCFQVKPERTGLVVNISTHLAYNFHLVKIIALLLLLSPTKQQLLAALAALMLSTEQAVFVPWFEHSQ